MCVCSSENYWTKVTSSIRNFNADYNRHKNCLEFLVINYFCCCSVFPKVCIPSGNSQMTAFRFSISRQNWTNHLWNYRDFRRCWCSQKFAKLRVTNIKESHANFWVTNNRLEIENIMSPLRGFRITNHWCYKNVTPLPLIGIPKSLQTRKFFSRKWIPYFLIWW